MTATAASVGKDRDRYVGAAALVVLVASITLQLLPARRVGTIVTRAAIARLAFASADVRRRAPGALGWEQAPAGADVYERDSLFVPPGVEARLLFNDGSVLELDERTLVVVERPDERLQPVAVRKGSVTGSAGNTVLELVTPQGTAQVAAQSQAHVEVTEGSVEMAVTKGEATIGNAALSQGARAQLVGGAAQAKPAWPVELIEPESNARRFFRGAPPSVALRWGGVGAGARVRVARDRGFSFVVRENLAKDGMLEVDEGPGVFWWRVVDPAGAPLSEARRFSVVEDVPALLLSPREGQIIATTGQETAELSWTQVRGVSTYRLELSSTPDFAAPVVDTVVSGARVKLALPYPEGIWFWRVRVAPSERPDAATSRVASFRLIHKPIPEAPQLLAPEIEVAPAR